MDTTSSKAIHLNQMERHAAVPRARDDKRLGITIRANRAIPLQFLIVSPLRKGLKIIQIHVGRFRAIDPGRANLESLTGNGRCGYTSWGVLSITPFAIA